MKKLLVDVLEIVRSARLLPISTRLAVLYLGVNGLVGCGGSGDPKAVSPTTPEPDLKTPFTGFAVDPTSATLTVGQTLQVRTSWQSSPGATVAASFSSSNSAIAMVSQSGLVTAVSAGQVTVSATVSGGGEGFATIRNTTPVSLTIVNQSLTPAITGIAVTPSPATLFLGDTLQLVSSAQRASSAVQVTYTYRSSVPTVATVSSTGRIVAVGVGTASVTVTGTGTGTGYSTAVREQEVLVTVSRAEFSEATMVATGGNGACARTKSAGVVCWGYFAPGNGRPIDVFAQYGAAQFPQGTRIASVAVANGGACAVTDQGALYCWGMHASGELGFGLNPTVAEWTPKRVPTGGAAPIVEVSRGYFTSCAVDVAGAGYCWGAGTFGALGTGDTITRALPTPIAMPSGVRFSQIQANATGGCAIAFGGALYCWGVYIPSPADGVVFGPNRLTPSLVKLPSGERFTALGTGESTTNCAISESGKVFCWGANYLRGRGADTAGLLLADITEVPMPAGLRFSQVSHEYRNACALATTGDAYCWGEGRYGLNGDSTFVDRGTPTRVKAPSGVRFEGVANGQNIVCAWSAEGAVYCWGRNQISELSDGTRLPRSHPIRMNPAAFPRLQASLSAGQSLGGGTATALQALEVRRFTDRAKRDSAAFVARQRAR